MNRDPNSIPISYLRECLMYFPDTGHLRWKLRPLEHFSSEKSYRTWNTRFAAALVGSPNLKGYLRLQIVWDGIKFTVSAHRAAWALHFGFWPERQIDHANGDTADNRIWNLRDASASQNLQNRRADSRNKLGVKGVGLLPSGRYWARIKVGTKQTSLGAFDRIEDAAAAYKDAAQKAFGEFARA